MAEQEVEADWELDFDGPGMVEALLPLIMSNPKFLKTLGGDPTFATALLANPVFQKGTAGQVAPVAGLSIMQGLTR